MTTITKTDFPLKIFRDFINEHPDIKFTLPGDAEWTDVTKCYIKTSGSPSIVVRPQITAHIQDLVRFCASQNVDFVVRSGGHDCMGRSQVNGALTIDMRGIQHVHVSEDKITARIGGGILTRELTKVLDIHGLITPTAPVASVGYVGWATLGGYGPLSTKYGLGVDQIVGAKYVNAEGSLIDAGEDELKAIRGAAGCLGVITEMTIKVYPLKEILEGSFVFESRNKHTAWIAFAEGYTKLISTEDIPPSLSLQPTGVAVPGMGNIFSLSCAWADEDHEEGRKWMKKIAALGTCIMEVVKPTTWSAHCEEKEKHSGYGVYGRAYTLNFKEFTPKTVDVLARYNASIPGPGSLFSMQFHRDPARPLDSVFSPREDHYWLEIIATARDEAAAEVADQWALALKRELLDQDPDNVLDSAYLGFLDDGETDLKKVFGDHYESLRATKERVDTKNVFRNSIPRL
ncbi:6-hydroxy-D-nicotine oxidase [Fusarium beomiforme]|uniref:6-hydroxy-D-nicotine oxidase n=1 Tax=Fusarium beomiforme TaxID=44412 RepID=A0A9P5AA64_9HYPO|nr:6-hydroxy-D-nicotine oxidase [Fusarium beomiforme]